ncbi:hypothetical protein D9619_009223 [Psilocybe cf. subviscida]|uniref:Uncharacterized protein n=1 Tax=Psilocybe cf. subviscida TaxID=2480587 RepID=A0A8H5BW90_9AGAR|nr:hypothetical protein D9619_009223 [Psilocybe cf. subviscida]
MASRCFAAPDDLSHKHHPPPTPLWDRQSEPKTATMVRDRQTSNNMWDSSDGREDGPETSSPPTVAVTPRTLARAATETEVPREMLRRTLDGISLCYVPPGSMVHVTKILLSVSEAERGPCMRRKYMESYHTTRMTDMVSHLFFLSENPSPPHVLIPRSS